MKYFGPGKWKIPENDRFKNFYNLKHYEPLLLDLMKGCVIDDNYIPKDLKKIILGDYPYGITNDEIRKYLFKLIHPDEVKAYLRGWYKVSKSKKLDFTKQIYKDLEYQKNSRFESKKDFKPLTEKYPEFWNDVKKLYIGTAKDMFQNLKWN